MRRRLALLHLDDLALENVACAELHESLRSCWMTMGREITAASGSRSDAAAIGLNKCNSARRWSEYRVSVGALGAQRSTLPHQLADGAKFVLGRCSRDGLDGAIELNDPLPVRGERGAAALTAADRGRHRRFL